jgi:hypothetical protein
VEVTESGKIFLSADGAGSNDAAGVAIQVDKPNAGATVRSAFLTCAGTSAIGNGQIQLDGTPISWDRFVINGFFRNVFADVTAVVKPKVDAAAPGLVDFQQTESSIFSTDGCGLYVIFDDAAQTTDNTVFILFGGQATGGDSFAIGLAEPLDASDTAEMGLAISFSGQDQSGVGGSNLCGTESHMDSQIDVNGQRLTSCAGNLDDGVGPVANGILITVGGIGDDPANPTDPFQRAADGALPRIIEDELYDLTALLGPADVLVVVDTLNPSNDDNIFAGHFTISTPAIIGEGVTLSPSSDTNPVGTQHTLTARVQDDNGDPVVGKQVTIAVLSGPNAGVSGTGVSDANGEFSLTYTGLGGPGVDQIQATFVDSQGDTQVSNLVTKEWVMTNEAPDCSQAVPSLDTIWPPNHKFVPVNIHGVTDPDGDPVVITIDSIFQDEPVDTFGDGKFVPDGQGIGTDTADVRAERSGTPDVPGNGRVYHIGYTVDDGQGGSCSGEVTVAVPHDQTTAPVDDGALYDSTVP